MGVAESKDATPLRFGGFESSNGPSVGAFYDVEQGELQGVLLVSQLSVENYSPSTGDRRLKEQTEDVFMSACFARKTKLGNVVAVGTHTGNAFVLAADDFSYLKTVRLNEDVESDILQERSTSQEAKGHYELPSREFEAAPRPSGGSVGWHQSTMVTCVNIPDKDTLLVGDSNGSLRVYQLTSGEALRVFDVVKVAKRVQDLEGKGEEAERESSLVSLSVGSSTPTEDEEPVRRKRIAPGREVVQAIVCSVPAANGGQPSPCLAVGLEKGTVVVFDLKTAEAVLVLETHPGLCYLGFIRSAHLLLCGFKFSNEVWVIDLLQGDVQVLDFTAELEAIHEGRTHCTAMCYSDEMRTLFVGTNAGKIFVRSVSVDERTRRLRVKLLKKGSPPKCDEPITSLWFDPMFDRLVTGDASGTVRLVTNATGSTEGPRRDHGEGSVHSGLVLNDVLRRSGKQQPVRTHTIVDEDDEEPDEQSV